MKNEGFRKVAALLLAVCLLVGTPGLPMVAYAEALDSGDGDAAIVAADKDALDSGDGDAAIVAADKDALAIGFAKGDSANGVTSDLTLPLTGASGSAIAWLSDTPEAVAHDGAVTRPDADAEDAVVTLTATITFGGAEDTREFTVTVLKAQAGEKAGLTALFGTMSVTWVGDGSTGAPFQVSSAEHLAWITANSLTAHYIQTADIDITGAGFTNWTPIAPYPTSPFTGSYNGNGYSISNLFINTTMREQAGLFGNIGSGGSLENITLTNASVSSTALNARIGALAGHNHGNIMGCSSSGSVSGGWAEIGGLVGTSNGTIEDSSSSAAVSGSNSAKVGGLVGSSDRIIRRSTSSGSVSGGDNALAGGLAGSFVPMVLSTAVIEECHSTGNVTGGAYARVGGLIGHRMSPPLVTDILNCSSSGNVTGGSGATLGGLIADDLMDPIALYEISVSPPANPGMVGEPLDITGLVATGTYAGNNTAVLPVTTAHISGFNSTAAATGQVLTVAYGGQTATFTLDIDAPAWTGDGSAGNPFKVTSPTHLFDVRNKMGAGVHFAQTTGIDLSGYPSWTPIGDTFAPHFTGSYDGGGYVISNLTITGSTSVLTGLFGWVEGTLKNIRLENVSVSSTAPSGNAGGLAAINRGTISQCSSTGSVARGPGGGKAGGLVGYNDYGTIAQCVTGGTVTGSGSDASLGGIAGMNNGNSTIINSYSSVAVSGFGSGFNTDRAGGLVGYNYGNVSDCYSTGGVSSTNPGGNAGGLIGRNQGEYSSVTGSYYDKDTAAMSDTGKGEPKSTADMKKRATFTDWDFDTVWKIDEEASYPTLRWQPWTPNERITEDRAALDWNRIKGENSAAANVTTDLALPTTGAQSTTITWSASPTGYISTAGGTIGAVTRPADENKAVTLTATVSYTDGTPQTVDFALTIIAHYAVTYHANGGTGTAPTEGKKDGGETFAAAAGNSFTPPSGKRFKHWNTAANGTGTSCGAGDSITMPAGPLDLYAIWEDIPSVPTYAVTITAGTGGSITSGTSGNYEAGTVISISASPSSGYRFDSWTASSGGTFGNTGSASTTFTVPDGATIITATFTAIGGGNNGGGSSGGSDGGSGVTPPPANQPDQPVEVGVPVTPATVSNGLAGVAVSDQAIADAIKKAQEEAKKQGNTANGIGVALNVSLPQGASALSLSLSPNALQSLVNAGVTSLTVNSGIASLSLNLEALKEIQKQSSGHVTITIKPVQSLSAQARALIGTRPVYDVTVSFVKDGKAVHITSLGKGSATLSFPYTPGANEAAGWLFGVYVNGGGNASRIPGSVYDANRGRILLGTGHLSVYGVGYAFPSEKYTDIATHWAKESIDYVSGRGVLEGTSKTTFSPDTAMTRGVLAMALGRLAGADVSAYKQSSFIDVSADKYDLPYVEWAHKRGVISGSNNGSFAPERAVTREEIALILQNYAKTTGYKLPVTREAVIFADASSIGSSYAAAVKAMQQAGVIMGENGNRFNPKAGATRAEVSAMLHRYVKLTIDPATAQGWAKNDGGQYLYYRGGKPFTGVQTIDGVKYFFNTDGTLKTGWIKEGVSWRYYAGNRMLVGWQDIDGKRYHFTKDGLMASGKWLEIGGNWYYFYADGSLARSTQVDGHEIGPEGARKTK